MEYQNKYNFFHIKFPTKKTFNVKNLSHNLKNLFTSKRNTAGAYFKLILFYIAIRLLCFHLQYLSREETTPANSGQNHPLVIIKYLKKFQLNIN